MAEAKNFGLEMSLLQTSSGFKPVLGDEADQQSDDSPHFGPQDTWMTHETIDLMQHAGNSINLWVGGGAAQNGAAGISPSP